MLNLNNFIIKSGISLVITFKQSLFMYYDATNMDDVFVLGQILLLILVCIRQDYLKLVSKV